MRVEHPEEGFIDADASDAAYQDGLSQIGGVSTGTKVNPSNLINQLHSYLHKFRDPDQDAAYQDDVRRG